MNKLEQVNGLLRAIKNIALQGIYAETYRGMEAQCVTTYRKCIATLKTVSGYEEVESLAPELADNASMKEISFAVETALSLISQGEGPTMHFGPGRGFRMPNVQVHVRRPGRQSRRVRGPSRRIRHGEHVEELQEEMEEKIEEEQERFEENIEKIEEEVEELQDKIEEIRDKLEERLEEIREKYEEKIEEIEEAKEEAKEEEEDEDKDEEPKA